MATPDEIFRERGELAALVRAKDWSQTSLGPPETWSLSLRTVLGLMLSSRYAMWLGWGPELLFFYNDAYASTLGAKHPWALGRPTREVWAEIWDAIGPRIDHVIATREATWDEGLLLFLERSGYAEETYHTFSYSPLRADDGGVGGMFCVVTEETEKVIGARRVALLGEFASALSLTKTAAEVLHAMEQCLARDGRDIPFSLTYLFDEGPTQALLSSRTGIRDDDDGSAPRAVPLGAEEAPWALDAILTDLRSVDVAKGADREWPAGPWSKPCARALVVPIAQAGQSQPAGALVAGINPHRALDSAYRSFLELFVSQLAAGLANARAYETARDRAESLAALDRAKTAFFSNISHEFRTPLTLMLGPTEDALASSDRALRGDDLALVHRNELRLLKLVNALLDFSRLEAGRVQATYEVTDLAGLTADLASAFRSAMDRGGLHYEVDCGTLSQPFYVDRDMWEKIVLNLLSNALKFTLEGSVSVRLREVSGGAVLEVSDSGPGVAADELPRMFERFHRIEGTPARTHEGSGIGLALVRDLVELHGGRIGIVSQPGSGSTFNVTIPVGSAHLPQDRLHEGGARPRVAVRADSFVTEAMRWLPALAASSAPCVSIPGEEHETRILVADDNADMREYLQRLLGEQWTVETVSDGVAALAAIRRNPPDLVLSDVMMPKLDGFGLVRQMREDPLTRTVPVILLSARAGEEATGEGLRAGANDYLIKPFTARDLVARVSSQLAIAVIRKESEHAKEAQRRVVESLFLSAPAGVALIRGEHQTIEFANPRALEIWGKSESVIGQRLLDAIPELRGQGFDDLVRQVICTGIPYHADETPVMLWRNGREETVFVNFVYAPAQNPEGVVDGIAAFGFDVTAQVIARQRATLGATIGRAFVSADDLNVQLRECCEALVVLGASFARIWTYNPAHETLELRASAGLYTHTDGPHARVPVGSFKIGRIAERRAPHLTNAVIGDPEIADQAWAAREGMVAFAGYPLLVGDRLVGVMALFAKRELSPGVLETLATVADQIALGIDRDSSERFRELFIGMLGHDLRNPLNAVTMGTHVMELTALDPQQRRTVDRIRNSASRMSRMIGQVLDFTRARSGGGIPIVRSDSDLHAICAQAIDELAAARPEQVIESEYRGNGAGAWDADRLAQVFSNLVGNALTYGRRDAPVRVLVDASGDVVVCTVHNLGPPIPPALLPTLFDPFRRASHGKAAGTHGLGLGLFIAQQIVMSHGGGITVRSVEDEGTTFTVELPHPSRTRNS